MQRIDAHQHFWEYHPVRESWITEDMKEIAQDFMPEDLWPELRKNNFDGCVLVQTGQSPENNAFMLQVAAKHSFIKGVVGWVDLQAPNLKEQLLHYKQFPVLKGFRHVLQAEKDRAFMLQPSFKKGVEALHPFGYTYDILIYPDQLPYIESFVSSFPEQKFVIDHIAKPDIKRGLQKEWAYYIKKIATCPYVFCKLSGMVTEGNWKGWKKEDFLPYLDITVNAFGTDRVMYGSDWPVCLVAATYEEVYGLVSDYFSSFSVTEQEKVFGTNAIDFYHLI